ncbi:DUF1949 domain-containing protein [Azohydromonas lata]|uniref:DUF1949 domain-containing protein n=1 Tax=Azohydromonas lata TaxID=45677 RepID=A0ABU5IK57_9BURK|nr:DUF1949 domain-containing protein [Azohydromonas lata]MDZ5459279.1 DUF1949 domain-containing protein [Azohydromonas lata]
MASDNYSPYQPPVTITLQVPSEQVAEFEQLLKDFTSGKVRALAPAFDFDAHDYRGAAQALVHDPDTTYALRARVLEDDKRDPTAALADAERLHALAARRFAEAGSTASVADGRDGLEDVGVQALQRLFKIAKGNSGQCGRVARFLLGLYNGWRFPFDLTLLRGVDEATFEDCVRVLRMDAMLARREVHEHLANGGPEFEKLAETWRMQDVELLKHKAQQFAEDVGFSGSHSKPAAELVEYIQNHR